MVYTKTAVQDSIRNRNGQRVFYLGEGDRLTEEAKDFLQAQQIPVLPAQQAKPQAYRLQSGGYCQEKPEHMTHLNGEVLVPKTHRRIVFRGAVDALEAELLLCQQKLPAQREALGEILALTRQLLRCDVLETPLHTDMLCGLTQAQQRAHSHFPQTYYGQPHFMPEWTDPEEILLLNRARCTARRAELAAIDAFSDRDGNLLREDIPRCLNRISSMLYILMIRKKAANTD